MKIDYLIFAVFAWVVFPIIGSTDLIEDWVESLMDNISQNFNNNR